MNVLDVAGPQAALIAELWWLTTWICVIVFVGVMAALALAVWRPSRRPRNDPALSDTTATIEFPQPREQQRLRLSVVIGVAISTILLVGLLVESVFTDHALAQLAVDNAVPVHIV